MKSPEARYLSGAELAQAGQYERAVEEMRAALDLQPTLSTARFQLGLLLLTMGNSTEAIAEWQPLEQLEDGNCLKLFKRGLEALIRDDFASCIQLLSAGIAANTSNPALSRDMSLVIARACDAQGGEVRTDFSLYDQ